MLPRSSVGSIPQIVKYSGSFALQFMQKNSSTSINTFEHSKDYFFEGFVSALGADCEFLFKFPD